MADLVVQIDEAVVAELEERAARKGISLNEEVLAVLREAVESDPPMLAQDASPSSRRELTEPEVQERLRRVKALGRKPLARVDLKTVSDELSDPVG